jgi:hypothetical protein
MSHLKPRYRSYADGSVRFLTQDNWISVNASPEASNAEAGFLPLPDEAAGGSVSRSARTPCPSSRDAPCHAYAGDLGLRRGPY